MRASTGVAGPGAAKAPATDKGRRTRDRVLEAAADLLHRQGVEATTLADVRAAAGVSSSQLYHYFADKRALVRAVAAYQAERIAGGAEARGFDSLDAFRAWRDAAVRRAADEHGRGGCPLGSLGAGLAETDPAGRLQVADGFDRWSAAFEEGLSRMRAAGDLPPDADPHALAVGLLAALQGGLLLSQLDRTADPLRVALDTALGHLELLRAQAAAARA